MSAIFKVAETGSGLEPTWSEPRNNILPLPLLSFCFQFHIDFYPLNAILAVQKDSAPQNMTSGGTSGSQKFYRLTIGPS